MTTLGVLRTRVRDRLDEDTARFWSDDQLDSFINEGVREVARRGEVIQTRASISTTANIQEYALPDDVVRVYRVEHQDSSNIVTPLEYRDFNNMDSVWWTSQKTTSSSRPYWYTMWGYPPNLSIVVYPTPANTAETLRVFYYSVPDDVSGNTDNIVVPQGWEDVVILYAEYVALRKDGDQRWQEAKMLYEEKMGSMIELTRRWTDQAGAVTVGTSFQPMWLYGGDW